MPESKTLRETLIAQIVDNFEKRSEVLKSALNNMAAAQKNADRLAKELDNQRSIAMVHTTQVEDSMTEFIRLTTDLSPYFAGAYCACVISTIGSGVISTILNNYDKNNEREDFIRGMVDCLAGAPDQHDGLLLL